MVSNKIDIIHFILCVIIHIINIIFKSLLLLEDVEEQKDFFYTIGPTIKGHAKRGEKIILDLKHSFSGRKLGENLSENSMLQNPQRRQSPLKKICCNPKNYDGFTVISICFFTSTIAVTCALILQIHYGSVEVTPHGAVASDNQVCSEIGIHAIRDGGSAVDATVASLACLSVSHPHVVGPGGGGVILVYDYKRNESKIFDFMVSFPEGNGRTGVPGFLRGLEKVHKKYGKLPWKTLFQPAITLARRGFNVSRELSKALSEINIGRLSPNFKTNFFPKGLPPIPGQVIVRKDYARFLQDVSTGGANELHLLRYGVEVMEAFQTLRTNITVQDFHKYKVIEREAVVDRVNNVSLISVGPPFAGVQVLKGLRLMREAGMTSYTHPNKLYEAFTKGLHLGASLSAALLTSDGDNLTETLSVIASENLTYERYPKEVFSVPASPLAAIDTYDLYVAAVVGLGETFGSGLMTKHGIVINRMPELDQETEPHLFQQRAPSPFTPLIAYDVNNICGQRVVLSSPSWSAMLQTVTQLALRNLELAPAIMKPRIALGDTFTDLLINDLDPRVDKLPASVREYLKAQEFTLKPLYVTLGVNGVSKIRDSLLSHSDIRGGGFAARLGQSTKTKNESLT